jgi:hypothetical protein
MNALQYPEADFTVLIREINKILTDSLKYLRNTTTRRKIRAEKAQEKGSAEGN